MILESFKSMIEVLLPTTVNPRVMNCRRFGIRLRLRRVEEGDRGVLQNHIGGTVAPADTLPGADKS